MRGRAAYDRHRRRLLRALCAQGAGGAAGAQRLRRGAAQGDGRVVSRARLRRDPGRERACRDRARRGRRLVHAAGEPRHQGSGGAARAGHQARRGRRAGEPAPGLGFLVPRRENQSRRRRRARLHAGGPHAGDGRAAQAAGACRDLAAHRQGGPARLLRRAGRGRHRQALRRARRLAHAGGFRARRRPNG